jgi:hypothetical protein
MTPARSSVLGVRGAYAGSLAKYMLNAARAWCSIAQRWANLQHSHGARPRSVARRRGASRGSARGAVYPAGGRGAVPRARPRSPIIWRRDSDSNPASSCGWLVTAARDCRFGRFEATSRVRPVTEGLRGGAAAAAQSKRTLGNCVGGAVPIDCSHIIALHQIGPVLNHLDRCHLDPLPQCRCYRDNLPQTPLYRREYIGR